MWRCSFVGLVAIACGCNMFTSVGDFSVDPNSGIDAGDANGDVGDGGGSSSETSDSAAETIGDTATSIDGGSKCGMPSGTKAVASSSTGLNTPDKTIDSKLDTQWVAPNYSGWLRLTFSSPQAVTEIRIAAGAYPSCDETYTISGWRDGAPSIIAKETRTVPPTADSVLWIPKIAVKPGIYDEIVIDVSPSPSWVNIGEIQICE